MAPFKSLMCNANRGCVLLILSSGKKFATSQECGGELNALTTAP